MKTIKKILATFFGLGYLPGAPGTFGAAGAYGIYCVCMVLGAPSYSIFILAAAATLIGVILTPWAREHFKAHDPKQFVIDEAAGFFLTMLFVPAKNIFLAGAIGFALFRFFDILKPFPINKLESAPHNLDVMADDLAGGLVSNIILRLIIYWVGGL